MEPKPKRDEPDRVSLAPLHPREALRGLLRVEPEKTEKTGSDSGENGRKHRKKKPAKKG